MQEEIHFISNCNECPFLNSKARQNCELDDELDMFPKKEVHKNCPLKNKQILIKLKR